jgi:Ni/Co efflux regulator RcnB
MKRLVLALAAIASVAGPMAVATEAAAQPRYYDRYDRYDRYDHYRSYRAPPRYYAPPPRTYYGPPRHVWRRGAYLPPAYHGYYVRDYGYYGLRPPPRGYRWHRVGNDYLLAAVATGLIFDIVTR